MSIFELAQSIYHIPAREKLNFEFWNQIIKVALRPWIIPQVEISQNFLSIEEETTSQRHGQSSYFSLSVNFSSGKFSAWYKLLNFQKYV